MSYVIRLKTKKSSEARKALGVKYCYLSGTDARPKVAHGNTVVGTRLVATPVTVENARRFDSKADAVNALLHYMRYLLECEGAWVCDPRIVKVEA